MKTERIEARGHELVLRCRAERAGYHAIIALHSTKLGPAVGGTRYWRYGSEAEAVEDALRLSRGMSYKNALAGLPFGGGKSVLLDVGATDRRALFEAHARAIEQLDGRYVTAEDVGTTVEDMEVMRQITAHVAGLAAGAGDPSPYTAHGVVRALQACTRVRFGSAELAGLRVAIQGVGAVGYAIARELRAAGADLVVSDLSHARLDRAVAELGAVVSEPDRVHAAPVDVYLPCALGGVLNRVTVAEIGAAIVVGAANNQLAAAEDGERLHARGVLYGPDYVANAGGVISGTVDILGWPLAEAETRIEHIYDTMLEVQARAAELNVSPAAAADAMAQARLSD